MDEFSHDAQRLLQLLDRLRPQLVGAAFRRLSELDLSLSHMRVLHLLHGGQRLAMKDLADHLCLKPPSVTGLTRRLVETGLVERRAHAEDSRVVLLALTEHGHDLHRQIHDEQLGRMKGLLARLSPDERRVFLDLLERVVAPEGEG